MISRISSGRRIMLTIVLGLALLDGISACTNATGASTPTPTPTTAAATSAAQRILEQAKRANLVDATFTISLTQTDPKVGTTVTGNGIGTLTTTPLRFASTFSLTDGSLAFEEIVDVPSRTVYEKDTAPPPTEPGKWDKVSSRVSVSGVEQTLVYYHLADAQVVGSESIEGVPVWHLHGTFPEVVTGATDQADVYLRQDSYLPVKVEVHSTEFSVTDEVFLFTAVNTGISIALPTADQISNS